MSGYRDTDRGITKGWEIVLATEKETSVTEPKEKALYSITFYRSLCKECGICGAFCPTHAITCNDLGRPEVVNADLCTNCHNCEYRCPDFAVTVNKREEVDVDKPPDSSPGETTAESSE